MNLFSGIFIICALVTTASALKCLSCVSQTGICTQKEEVCSSAQSHTCRTLSITQITGQTPNKWLVKGCGNCIGILSFSSGEFSVHTADRCCQSDLCNNQIIAEANSTLNGLECYGCSPISNKVCEDPTETVKCVGEQKWCGHTSATRHSVQNVTIKGCTSENICKNPDVIKMFDFAPKQDFYCCKGSRCNRGSERSEVSTAPTNTVAATSYSPTVQQYIPLLTLPLIALILCLF